MERMPKQKNKKSKHNEEDESIHSSLYDEKKSKKMKKEELQGGVVQKDEEQKVFPFAHHQKKITDPRFSSLHSDPRFKPMSRRKSKIPIDSRFAAIFTDEKFASSAPVDKRGRPSKGSSGSGLSNYYRLSDDDGHDQQDEERHDGVQKKRKKKTMKKDGNAKSREKDEIREEQDAEAKKGILQLANGSAEELVDDDPFLEDGNDDEDGDIPADLSSCDSEGSSDDSYSETNMEDESEEEVPLVEESTHRLAMVNMDWDHVKAVDLYVLMSSFLPEGGYIKSIAVYPSEFGIKSMEEEAVRGPSGIFASDDDQDSDGDATEIDEAKLRAYEKSKLRYYYAVVECDSRTTADYLYKECDGVEYERTSNLLDLRFIPDDMQFQHPPRDTATEAPANYECKDFHTRALQQSKVHLSWDNDEPERIRTLRQKLSQEQLDEMEFKEFLASDDDGDEDDSSEGDHKEPKAIDKKEMKRNKLLALLQPGDGSEDSKEDMDMEVAFNTDLESISKRVIDKQKNKDSESVWETYLRKKREKKKAKKRLSKMSSEDEGSDSYDEVDDQPDDFFVHEEELDRRDAKVVDTDSKKHKLSKKNNTVSEKEKRKAEGLKENAATKEELELLLAEDDVTGDKVKGYNLKSKKKKGKKKEVLSDDEIPEVDYNDPRLSALFSSPLFALDPTDPRYKRSAAYLRQQSRKQKGIVDAPAIEKADKTDTNQVESEDKPSRKDKLELMSLVKSVKRKVGSISTSNR